MKVTTRTNTLTFASLFLSCARAENLRVGGRDLAELWEKMESINNELRDKITGLEREVNQLQEHRLLTAACNFTLTDDDVCHLTQSLEILANLTVAGNSTFDGNFNVTGNSTFLNTTSIAGDLAVTGLTELEALNVNSTLDVNGDVYFAGILDVAAGFNVTGVINATDLAVLNTVTVLGDSKFEGNVTIEAMVADSILGNEIPTMPTLTLTVGGNLEIAGGAIIAGRTTLQDDVTIAYAPPPLPAVPVESKGPGHQHNKKKGATTELDVAVEVLGYPSLFVAGGILANESVTFAKMLTVAYGNMAGLSVSSGCDGCTDNLTLSLSEYTEAPTSAPTAAPVPGKKKGPAL